MLPILFLLGIVLFIVVPVVILVWTILEIIKKASWHPVDKIGIKNIYI